MGVTVRLDSTEIEAQPGEQAVCTVHLENDGMVVDSYLLDVLGDSASWATVEPAEVNLLPQARATARIVFTPPRSPERPAGQVPFGLRVMSREDPDGSKIEEGAVTVGEFTEIAAGLVPKTANGRRKAKFKLLVENHGNRVEQVAVSVDDPDQKLSFRTDPQTFDAQPGTATYVKLRTIPRKTFLRGPNKSLPFVATAQPDGGDPVTADGVMLEHQTMPKWLLPALGAMVLVAAAIVALWFAVLRPEVHSAATAATAAQQAASQAAKNAAANATPPANALSVTVPSSTLLAGGNEQANVNGSAAVGGAGKLPQLLWTSSAPGVATVSQTGEVTAVSPGSATITATSASSNGKSAGGAPVLSGTVTVNVVGPLSVSTGTMPPAPIGKPYSAPVIIAGGTGTYAYSVSAGTLPAGLSLDATTGIVSGTPTALGTSSFTVHIDDAGPPTQFITQNLTLNVISALQVNTASLPNATINAPYSQTLAAVGGSAPYTWSIATGGGTLPAGLSLNSGTGVISGTPTAGGTTTFTVKVSDAGTPSQSATQSLTIDSVAGVLITTTTMPDAVSGTAYSQTPSAAGGTTPYTWSVAAGSLPPGLSLNATNGTVSGTPTSVVKSSFSFTLQAADSGKPALIGSQAYTINVVLPFGITTSSLPSAPTGADYPATQLTGTGGTTPYSWTLKGTLPPGLQLSQDGQITGTPTTTGTFGFTVLATDSGTPPLSATQNLTITIVNPLTITTKSLPYGVTGVAYNQTVDATGGTKPYAWSVTPPTPPTNGGQPATGNLPPGLSLASATGVISGTPSTTGSFPVNIAVVDATTPSLSFNVTLTITVYAPVAFTEPSALPIAVAGQPYAQASPPTATGGLAPYSWSLSGGTTLPPGLVLDPKTGAITSDNGTSGTATDTDQAGTDTFQLTVTDANNPALSQTNSESITVISQLTISPPSLPSFQVGQQVTENLASNITGGVAPYTVHQQSGTTLDGLSLSQAGVLSGSPTGDDASSGNDQIVTIPFTVTDSTPGTPQTTTINLSVTVTPATLSVTFAGGTLPAAFGGSLYAAQPTTNAVSGGLTPYQYTVTAGALPNGLTIDSGTGQISGTITPSTACVARTAFTVTVTSADGQTAKQQFTLGCTNPSPLIISTLTLPDAVFDTAYTQAPSASGGIAPYTWSVETGSLPAGLSLNAATGTVSGTPTAVKQSDFTLQVTDSAIPAHTTSQAYTINVVQPFGITTLALPGDAENSVYPTTQLTGAGGTTPYVWTLRGNLPPGLQLLPDGEIQGTPTATGLFSFTVQATDSGSPPLSAMQNLSITISSPLKITTTSVQAGVVNTPYSQTLNATGGTKPYSWTVTGGTLPTGLNLAPDTGVISGTPGAATATPTPTVTITLSDATTPPVTATLNLQIAVVAQMAFTEPAALPVAVAGQPYAQASAPVPAGGTGPYTWSLSNGTTLPPGLGLNPATGAITSGTGTVSANAPGGPDTFQLTVTDSGTPPLSATNNETITVVSQLSVVTPSLPSVQVGQQVDQNLAADIRGGLAPYSVTPQSGSAALDGLSLSSEGVLTGAPTGDNGNAGANDETVSIPFTVTDSTPGTPQTATITVSLTVTPATLSVPFASSTLPAATAGASYSAPTTTGSPTGGLSPYQFSVPTGDLPGGLSIDSRGVISGSISTSACTAETTFTVTVTSADGQTAKQQFTIACTN